VDEECRDILAETLQVDEALPAVKTLNVAFGNDLNNPTSPFLPSWHVRLSGAPFLSSKNST